MIYIAAKLNLGIPVICLTKMNGEYNQVLGNNSFWVFHD